MLKVRRDGFMLFDNFLQSFEYLHHSVGEYICLFVLKQTIEFHKYFLISVLCVSGRRDSNFSRETYVGCHQNTKAQNPHKKG